MSPFDVDPAWEHDPAALAEPARQLREYFAGERTEFELELDAGRDRLPARVWERLLGDPLRRDDDLRRARAASSATRARCARSGWPTAATRSRSSCPCHRVIGADGSLVGYGGGLERKRIAARARGGGRCRLPCNALVSAGSAAAAAKGARVRKLAGIAFFLYCGLAFWFVVA